MIPKIIHYCWFGRGSKPVAVTETIAQWRKQLPDYDIIEWNESNFDINSYNYSREAYATGNYAFVADVCRMQALYDMGGIYLDTDVEVVGSFEPYLPLRSFLSYEDYWIGTAAIGAEPGSKWIGLFLDYYRKRHFINIFGHAIRTPNTKILSLRILPRVAVIERPTVFPIQYFCANNIGRQQKIVTAQTVCIHHFSATWKRRHRSLPTKIKELWRGMAIRFFHSQQS